MKINDVTAHSKKRAEEIAKREGGFLVPVYAVVKTDNEGRVMSVTHDRLQDVKVIEIN